MNEYYEANKRSLILLAIILFLLAVVLYFMVLRPLQTEYKNERNAINDLNHEIQLLEAQIQQLQEASQTTSLEQLILENKIPSERELDEYILALQQLELHTESRIETIEFKYDSNLDVAAEEEQEETSDNEAGNEEREVAVESDVNEEESDEEDETEENTVTPDPQLLNEKPDQLQVLTVSIEAISPNFDELIELLKLIENNQRISIVTSLEFTKPAEEAIYFSDDPTDIIPFEAVLTTFYYQE